MYIECNWCGKYFYRKKIDSRNNLYYCSQDCITARDVNNYKIRYLRENKTFRIIHYENKNNVKFACRTCGEIYQSKSTNALKRKVCYNCIKIRQEKEAEAKQQIKVLKHQRTEYAKKLEQLTNQLERRFQRKLTQEQREEEIKKTKRARDKRHELKRNDRIKNNGRIDQDIELSRLYKRDNGVCYICGKQCDYSDYKYNDNGVFIAGNNYPSIDHVEPLSKGGLHTWDNIKLAHRLCNSLKKDTRGVL